MIGDPPKVLFCSFDVIPEPTGSSARATVFIRGLSSFNVDGLTAKSPDHPHIERYHGARLMRVPVGSGDLPVRVQAFERAVRRQLESDEYHLVHFTDPYGGYALCELREQYSFKLLYEVIWFPSVELKHTHPHLDGDRRFLAKLRRQELFCLMNADAVLTGSEVTAAMIQGLGVSRDRIRVLPTGVDLAPYDDALLPRPDRTPMRALYLGSQSSWQGLSTAVAAIGLAAQSCDVRLSIVGPQHPSWRLQLEETIKFRGLADRVELLGAVTADELPKLLATVDVGLAPFDKSDRNLGQGAPIAKIAHYLAAGRPVIASELPMVREVTSPDCALLHEPGDENGLAHLLVELAKDPARRCAMGEAGRALARSRLCAERVRGDLIKLYAELLSENGIEVPIPVTAAAPAESFSDAATSIGTMGTDIGAPLAHGDETVTHSLRGEGEGPTDPARRLSHQAEAKAFLSDAFTDPGLPVSAPNLFVSQSLFSPPPVTDPAAVPVAPEPPADTSPRVESPLPAETLPLADAMPLAGPAPLFDGPPLLEGPEPILDGPVAEEPRGPAANAGEPSDADEELLQGELLLEGTLLPEEPEPVLDAAPAAPTAAGPAGQPAPLPWEAILGAGPRPAPAQAKPASPLATGENAHERPQPAETVNQFGASQKNVAPSAGGQLPPIARMPANQAGRPGMGPPLGTQPPSLPASSRAHGASPAPPPLFAARRDPLEVDPSDVESILSFQRRQEPAPSRPAAPIVAAPSATAPPLPPIITANSNGAGASHPLSRPVLERQPSGRPPVPPTLTPQAPAAALPPLLQPSEAAATKSLSPESGCPSSDEWLGHLLFGYAPFRVPLARRALTGEFQVTPIPRR